MGAHAWKREKTLAAAALPDVLRALADVLEGRDGGDYADVLAGLPASELRKLVLVAELHGKGEGHGQGEGQRQGQRLTLKLKAKRAGELLVPSSGKALAAPSAQVAVKVPAKATTGNEGARKEKYRQLKKGLQADFKVLERAVVDGAMPPGEVLDSFLSRAEIMAAQPALAHSGQGEDAELKRANAIFLEDALALRAAAQKRDPAALAEVLARLNRRKSACHAQFK